MTASIKVVRVAVNIIAGLGVSKVVSDVVKNNTNVTTPIDHIRVLIGGTVLSTIAADLTKRHVDAKIDNAVAWYNERTKTDEENAPEEEVETK